MKNNFSWLHMAKESVNLNINQQKLYKLKFKKKTEEWKRKEHKIYELWNNMKWNNIIAIGVSKGKERMGQKKYLKRE